MGYKASNWIFINYHIFLGLENYKAKSTSFHEGCQFSLSGRMQEELAIEERE